MAVTSPVHLEIAPLDLTPWPSTASSVGRLGSMGRQASLAPQLSVVTEHTQEQVRIVQLSAYTFTEDTCLLCYKSSQPQSYKLKQALLQYIACQTTFVLIFVLRAEKS